MTIRIKTFYTNFHLIQGSRALQGRGFILKWLCRVRRIILTKEEIESEDCEDKDNFQGLIATQVKGVRNKVYYMNTSW